MHSVLGKDVWFYHTDKFYSRLNDIPERLNACDLISVSRYANRYIKASMRDPSIKIIADLRNVGKKNNVKYNPEDFEFSKYGVIYREDPKLRKIGRYKGLPIETIMEIVKWIYEDYSTPISCSYYERLDWKLLRYIKHLTKEEQEKFHSLFV